MLKIFIISIVCLLGGVILLSAGSHLVMAGMKKRAEKQLETVYLRDNFSPDELLADIDWYEVMLERVHPEEIPEFPLGDVSGKIKNLKASITRPMTRLEFFKIFAPVVSGINDEHTTVLLPNHELEKFYNSDGKVFPFIVSYINGSLYIKENLSENSQIKAGMEIISINGISSEELKATLMLYFSGSRDDQKLFYLQEHFSDAFYIGYGAIDSFRLILKGPGDEFIAKHTVEAIAIGRKQMKHFYYELIDNDTMLFTYNLFQDYDHSFTDFLKEIFQTIQNRNITNLIVDLRKNKGGHTYLGDIFLSYIAVEPFRQFSRMDVLISEEARKAFLAEAPGFVRWFPVQYFHPILKPLWAKAPGDTSSLSNDEVVPQTTPLRFEGNLYVVIGPGSMSSATMLPSTIQKYELGELIGENTGGLDTMYGNITTYRLPNTGLEIEMPCAIVYGNSSGSIEPEHRIEQTVEHLADHKDTIMEYIKELIRRGNED